MRSFNPLGRAVRLMERSVSSVVTKLCKKQTLTSSYTMDSASFHRKESDSQQNVCNSMCGVFTNI